MVQPLRIALVTNNYTPYSGGVVSSLIVLIKELQKRGHVVTLITLDFTENKQSDPVCIYRVPCPIQYTYKKNHMAIPWRPNYYVLDYLKRFAPDIVHVHHPFLLGISGLQAARSLHLPVIFTYHTIYEAYSHYVPFFTYPTQAIIKKIVASFCRRVDYIVAPSSFIRENIKRAGITTPSSIVPSAIQDCFIQRQIAIKQPGIPIILLSVGRFAKEKNLSFLIDVVAALGYPYKLVLVGYGSYQDYLQWYAYTKWSLSHDQVVFVVRPSKEQLIGFYRTAHFFLFSSKTDTQGLVLAEAMAGGTPVIALDGPGQRDCIKQGYNGYIVHSKSEMIKIIQTICNDILSYESLAKGALQISKRYWPHEFGTTMETVYRQVLMHDNIENL